MKRYAGDDVALTNIAALAAIPSEPHVATQSGLRPNVVTLAHITPTAPPTLEQFVAALITPSTPDMLDKIMGAVPADMRAQLLRTGIIQLAKARAEIASELRIGSDDITMMRMRGAARKLSGVVAGDSSSGRLIPSEIVARERALTEVAAILHVAHGRDLAETDRIIGQIASGAAQPDANPSSDIGASVVDRKLSQITPRRRDILRRSAERCREQNELDKFLRERLRQIVHQNVQGNRQGRGEQDIATGSIAAQVVVQRIRHASSRSRHVASGRTADLHRASLRRASALTEDAPADYAAAPDGLTGPNRANK